jgi:uncharacterized sulfatase
MDERYDIIRMVRDKRFKYLRNYEPLKPYYQHMATPEQGATMRELRRLHEARQLPEEAERYFAKTKPLEELYDTQTDPHELRNLALDPAYADVVERFRHQQLAWSERTKDLGMIPEPILAERERQVGHCHGILPEAGGDELARRVARTAVNASQGTPAIADLVAAMHDVDAAVRYWGAVGIGNMGECALAAESQVRDLLDDQSAAVRIAAARALCRLGVPEPPIAVLAQELNNGAQWERLQAAIALDEIGPQAEPVVESMRAALQPRAEFFGGGKYTVRVIQHALSRLDHADHAVR